MNQNNFLLPKHFENLLLNSVMEEASHCSDEFISNIFTRVKKKEAFWVIWNLKELNEHTEYFHFKIVS